MKPFDDIGLLNLINWRRAQAASLHAERVGETEWRALEELVLTADAEAKAWAEYVSYEERTVSGQNGELEGFIQSVSERLHNHWQNAIGRKNRAMKAIREWGREIQHQDPSPK